MLPSSTGGFGRSMSSMSWRPKKLHGPPVPRTSPGARCRRACSQRAPTMARRSHAVLSTRRSMRDASPRRRGSSSECRSPTTRDSTLLIRSDQIHASFEYVLGRPWRDRRARGHVESVRLTDGSIAAELRPVGQARLERDERLGSARPRRQRHARDRWTDRRSELRNRKSPGQDAWAVLTLDERAVARAHSRWRCGDVVGEIAKRGDPAADDERASTRRRRRR